MYEGTYLQHVRAEQLRYLEQAEWHGKAEW